MDATIIGAARQEGVDGICTLLAIEAAGEDILYEEAPDLYGFFINPALSSQHSGPAEEQSQREEWRNSPSGRTMTFAGRLNRKNREHLTALLNFLPKSALGTLGLAVVTAAALLLHLNLAAVGPLYLLAIVVVALHWGFWQATLVSTVAVLCECYFFVPPVFSFDVADAKSYSALIVFECTALIVSRLSAREQRNAREAELQLRRLAMLYELSRRTQQLDFRQPPGLHLLQLIRELFPVDAVAIFDLDLDTIDMLGRSFPTPKRWPGTPAIST